jgi:hypothetical protein
LGFRVQGSGFRVWTFVLGHLEPESQHVDRSNQQHYFGNAIDELHVIVADQPDRIEAKASEHPHHGKLMRNDTCARTRTHTQRQPCAGHSSEMHVLPSRTQFCRLSLQPISKLSTLNPKPNTLNSSLGLDRGLHHLDDASPEHVVLGHAIELETSILEEVYGSWPHDDQNHVHHGRKQPYQVSRLEELVLRESVFCLLVGFSSIGGA